MLDNTTRPEVRQALLLVALDAPKMGFRVELESHGVMSSLALFRGPDWCFSFRPAQDWLKLWIRRPELTRHHVRKVDVVDLLPDVQETKSKEITARLRTYEQTETFLALLGSTPRI